MCLTLGQGKVVKKSATMGGKRRATNNAPSDQNDGRPRDANGDIVKKTVSGEVWVWGVGWGGGGGGARMPTSFDR